MCIRDSPYIGGRAIHRCNRITDASVLNRSSHRNYRGITMAIIHTLLVALCSVAAVLTAGNVQAQTIPPEGPVSVTFTATLIPPLKPMPIGGGKEFVLV